MAMALRVLLLQLGLALADPQKPERIRRDFHNLFVVVMMGLITAWVAKVMYQIFRAAEVNFRLTRSRSLQLEAMSIYAQDFQMLIRQHFNQILRIRRTVPPKLVARHEVTAHVHPESIRCLWVGEEDSGGGPMGFGVEFDIDASVPCCVQLYWGVNAQACNEFVHRSQAESSQSRRGNSLGPLRNLRGRWTGGRSCTNPETTRSLLEMEDLTSSNCVAPEGRNAPASAETAEDRLFAPSQYHSQSRDFFLPAGCGQRYVTPAGDLIHPNMLSELDMRAEWLRSGQEPAVIPLAIVVIASGSKASTSVQGRPVLETKGQISIVRFTEGRGQSAPFNSAEVIRQLCFSENSAMEVQGIYGFEDAGESECMICYARPKNVLLLPCRHCSVCHSCLRSLRDEKCPLCRSSFSSYLTCPSRQGVGKQHV
ncbi:unnamed protein product [Effrenium voratum]|uniref:RING-type domain-containing protein n=1 Tax=Effrenium voratum TaxID=2562239 RepID=A0AA36IJC9_9DINO|nr:unnamed protein product [Effrenium voratum]